MALPSCEVPTPQATLVLYCPGWCSYVSAMVIAPREVPAFVAKVAPRMVANGCKSWGECLPGALPFY